jgi:hypothetical protein
MKVLTLASILLLPGALIAGVMGNERRLQLRRFRTLPIFWVSVAKILIALATLATARIRHWI